jgi:tRNA A-37 threonylcarbamoyl transferase component Bud32/tetratricopeptide (TPR) repeat protein
MGCLQDEALRALATGDADEPTFTAHLFECATCRERLAQLSITMCASDDFVVSRTVSVAPASGPLRPPASAHELARGTSIGRYTVLELVGRGGMGEVYAAYDPQLDRKIALKLLRTDGREAEARAEARLLREAKAIARVSHPNVVTVHDAGTFGDRIFVAMEFVEGATLKEWLAERPRQRAEILEVFAAASQGLAAAHAAGLVHRDFKPPNVMVGRDGAVRVTDFGLVRQVGHGDQVDEGAESAAAGAMTGNAEVDLTRTGEVVGTPRYMSPEQFKGDPLDARTDQFSFCVALYEALYGQRAFAGDGLADLMANVLEGRVSPPPLKSTVPGWLRRVLLRGLEVDPARRFPSMEALSAALEADPGARRRRAGMALGLLATLALAVVGARRIAGSKPALCRSGPEPWSQVWPTGKDALHAAFVATGRSYAEQAFVEVSRALDAYVSRWNDMYTDACEATQVRGEQSAEILDLRMGCLNERLGRARALVDVLAHADGTVVDNAVSAAGALPALGRCADVGLLRAVVRPPDDEASRRRVGELRANLAHLVAVLDSGRCQEAEKVAEVLIPRVRQAGYAPLIAQTLHAAASLVDSCGGEPAVGFARWEEAFSLALAARDDDTAAHIAIAYATELARRADDLPSAQRWIDIGRALVARMGSAPLLATRASVAEADILMKQDRGAEAADLERRAIQEKEALLGPDDVDVAASWNGYGTALESAGRSEEAVAAFERSADVMRRKLGPGHARVAAALENEGESLLSLHRNAEALGVFEQASTIWTRAGASPLMLARGQTGTGMALVALDRPTEALPRLEEALQTQVALHAGLSELADTRFALARALWHDAKAHERALMLARQARSDAAGSRTASGKRKLAPIDAWLSGH